jgi:hypothetical protein
MAACVLHKPRLLLLDEPTAGVDAKARRAFWDLIADMAAGGMTVLVSTHYMDEAERCHRVVYLSGGRLIVEGSAEDVVHGAKLVAYEATGEGIGRLVSRARGRPGPWRTCSPFRHARWRSCSARSSIYRPWLCSARPAPGRCVAVFAVPVEGSVPLLLVALGVFTACNLALGFTLSSVAGTPMQALQMAMGTMLPSLLMSGFMFRFAGTPAWARGVGECLPITHIVRIARGILLKGNRLDEIMPEVWPMVAFALIVGTITVRSYRHTLD